MAQPQPETTPSAENFEWGAQVFKARGGFMPYSTKRLALRVHSNDVETLGILAKTFGGRVTGYAGTYRWLLYAKPLIVFLEGIAPYLGDDAEVRKEVEDALGVLAMEARTVGRTVGRPKIATGRTLAQRKLLHAAFLEEPGAGAPVTLPLPRRAKDLWIPPPPWDADGVTALLSVLPAEGWVFRQQADGVASDFAEFVEALGGFEVEPDGEYVRIVRLAADAVDADADAEVE